MNHNDNDGNDDDNEEGEGARRSGRMKTVLVVMVMMEVNVNALCSRSCLQRVSKTARLTAQLSERNPCRAMATPLDTNGNMCSPSRASRNKARRMFRACT